jgi:Fe-S-cluster-containing dehydrogenase component
MHLELIEAAASPQTAPTVCMHCEDPTCAAVCPADAIKATADGVVHSASKSRCIACSNCVLACPFGVPEVFPDKALMMKCDMCCDRTSVGLRPMCATVCPSGALFFGDPACLAAERPHSRPLNAFRFGDEVVRTRVQMMVPAESAEPLVDVTAAMGEFPASFSAVMAVFDGPDEPSPEADHVR